MLRDKALLIDLIDKLLSEILRDTITLPRGSSPFHCKEIPAISTGNYLGSTLELIKGLPNSPTALTPSSCCH